MSIRKTASSVVSPAVVQPGQHIGLVQVIQFLYGIRQLVPEEPVDQHRTDRNQPGLDMQLLHLVEFRIDYKISEEVLQVMHREDVVRFFVVHHLVRKQPASRKFLPLHRFSIQAAADNIECLFLQGIAVLNQFFLYKFHS